MMLFLKILSFFLDWFYVFTFLNVIHIFLPLRPNFYLRLAAFFVCNFVSTVVIYSNDLPGLVGALLGFSLMILVFHWGYWAKKITTILVFYPTVIAVNYLMQDIGARCFFWISKAPVEESMGWSSWQLLLSTAFYALSLLLRLLFWIVLWLFLRKSLFRTAPNLTGNMWRMVDLLALAPFTAIFTIIYFMPKNPLVVYPICFASIFSSFGCIYLVSYICVSMETAYHAQELEQKQAYYQQRQNAEERVRALYHDMKNHLLVLERQLSTPETLEMIEKLQQEVASYEDYIHTGNDILDIILAEKAALAREKQIAFSVAADLKGMDFMEPLDISAIFGNGLDNAMEASEQLEEGARGILLKAGKVQQFLSILIVNNCAGKRKASHHGTTKQDPFFHGFGIPNMKKAVAKYGGQLTTRYGKGTFTLKILIPIPLLHND